MAGDCVGSSPFSTPAPARIYNAGAERIRAGVGS